MTACGAEFGWSESGGVVCGLSVHKGDHEAAIRGRAAEYGGDERRAVARVTWPQASSEHASGPQSDAQGGAGGRDDAR